MKTRKLGHSGLEVSIAALGCANFGTRIADSVAAEVIDAALAAGINFFDTADVYGGRGGSERVLGQFLGPRRQHIVLATKFGRPMDAEGRGGGTTRHYVAAAVNASLARLQTDWIDLLQIHWPNPATPIEETLRGFEDVVTAGKVRFVGASNFAAWQLVEASMTARQLGLPMLVSTQAEYNLLTRHAERELIPAAQAHGVALLPYLPLAGGVLAGKYQRGASIPKGARLDLMPDQRRYLSDANFTLLDGLAALARTAGRSMLDLAFGWLAAQAAVTSILCGPSRPEQVASSVAAAQCTLDADELAALQALLDPAPG